MAVYLISSYLLQSRCCIYSKRLFFLTITTLKIFMGYSHSSWSYCVKAIHCLQSMQCQEKSLAPQFQGAKPALFGTGWISRQKV